MKKLIILLMFFASAKAQVYVEVWDAGQKKLIPYVAGITVTKASLGLDQVNNTSDYNKPISAAVQNAVNNLSLLLATKADKGSLPGGTFTGTFKGSNTNTLIFEPENYNPSLKQGRFSISNGFFPSVNLPNDIRANVVLNYAGYNTTPGGGQEIAGEASYRFAGESHYDIGGGKYFEFHIPDLFTNAGLNVRPLSLYIRKSDGLGSMNMQMEQFNFKLVNDINHDWFSGMVADKNVRYTLNPKQGGQASIILNGRLAKAYPNQTQFDHSQVEFVTTGQQTAFYSTVPFYFNKPITAEGLFLKSANGRVWKITVSDTGAITAQ